MKKINDLVSAAAKTLQEKPLHLSKKHEAINDESEYINKSAGLLVNKVIELLKGIYTTYTYSFKEIGAEARYKKELTRSFIEFGVIHTEQLKIGLLACRKSDLEFLPRAATFAKWCLGGDLLTESKALKYLKQLSAKKSFSKMSGNINYKCDHIVSALYEFIDFNFLKTATEKQAIAHCKTIYGDLMSTGYKETSPLNVERLETSAVVVSRFDQARVLEVANRKINNPEYQKMKEQLRAKSILNSEGMG